jgi:hypothetical protein
MVFLWKLPYALEFTVRVVPGPKVATLQHARLAHRFAGGRRHVTSEGQSTPTRSLDDHHDQRHLLPAIRASGHVLLWFSDWC